MNPSRLNLNQNIPNSSQKITINSRVLGEKRNIYIHLPEEYDQVRRHYPILCVLDGEWLYDIVRANLRFYSECEVMGILLPQMIIVGIENVDRDRDYVPTSDPQDPPLFKTAGKADAFAEFLNQELFPYLEQEYRVLENRTVVGWSFGGLFALYSAIQHQDLFDSYLCIGPAIWWDNELVNKMINEIPFRKKTRVVITCGSEEEGGLVYNSVRSLLKTINEAPPENWVHDYIEIEGVGHSWGIPEAVDRGLKCLYEGYLPADDPKSLDKLMNYYAGLSKEWGYDVEPPESVMIKLAKELWSLDESKEAFEVLDQFLDASPNSSTGYFCRGKFLSSLDRKTESIEAFRKAVNCELVRPVPNHVYLRAYYEKIKALEDECCDAK